jgi:hypothetical protein
MKKFYFLTIISFLVFCTNTIAQTYEVPQNYILKAKEDYANYEADVINTIDWLQQTSWDDNPDKRKDANTFFVAWITGSPTVSIAVGKPLVDLCGKNKELLITFMGGFTKYSLQHKDAANKNEANIAGLRALINKYAAEKNHVKDKAVEKLIQLDKDGKLEAWAGTDFVKS